MNCAEVRFLITMHRPGERTAGQEVFLFKHLETCPECKSWKETFELTIPHIQALAGNEPLLPHPTELAGRIMARTVRVAAPRSAASWIDDLLDAGTRPAVRSVLVGVMSVALCFFLVQTYLMFHGVREVETSLSFRQVELRASAIDVQRNFSMIFSDKSTEVIKQSLGIGKVESLIAALTSGQRAQLVDLAKRYQVQPLRPIGVKQLRDLVKSVPRSGRL